MRNTGELAIFGPKLRLSITLDQTNCQSDSFRLKWLCSYTYRSFLFSSASNGTSLYQLSVVLYICTKVKKGLILVKGKVNKVANVRARLMFCAEQYVFCI